MILLDYEDFGPQAIAYEVIGTEWWQWRNCGGPRFFRHDVKVVVYKSMPLEEIKKRYPVDPGEKRDFRYLEYRKALDYLNEKIEENVIEDVSGRLKSTRERILDGHIGK